MPRIICFPRRIRKNISREHILILTFIYYFKNILSIKDIETLLKPITEKYFHTDENLSMTDIYEEICSVQKSRIDSLQEELKTAFARSENSFSKVYDGDKEQLQLFSLLCDLSFDVYVKKQIIENCWMKFIHKNKKTRTAIHQTVLVSFLCL